MYVDNLRPEKSAAYNGTVSNLRAYAIVLLAFGVLMLAAWGIVRMSAQNVATTTVPGEATEPPSPEIMAYLAKSTGFQYLVSFTERGFEPSTITIKKGETVRFINNSSEDLWVSATGDSGAVYPGTGKECGQSSFDTCKTLKKGEFWEFTLADEGAWSYHNNFDLERMGVIVVK
jgi:plastocyanin